MAAPQVRGVGALAAGTGAIEPGLPAGTEENDLLICCIETAGVLPGGAATIEPIMTAAWSKIKSVQKGNTRCTVYYALNSPGINRKVEDTGDHQQARIIGIKKGTFRLGEPIDPSSVKESASASSSAFEMPATATEIAEELVVGVSTGHLPDANGSTQFSEVKNASLTEVTERVDQTTAEGDGGALFVFTGVKAAAGVVGVTTVKASTNAERAHLVLAVAPPEVAPANLTLSKVVCLGNTTAALTAKTALSLGTVPAASNATAVVSRKEPLPLSPVAATSSPTAALTARTTLSLATVPTTSEATLGLKAGVPLGSLQATGLSSAAIAALTTAVPITASPVAGLSNATLAAVVPVRLTLSKVAAAASPALLLEAKTKGPAVRGVGEAKSNTGAMTVPPPAGTQEGDFLLLFIESGGPLSGTEAVVPPEASGWGLLDTQVSNNTRLTVLGRIATGGPADTASVTDTGDHQLAQMMGIKAESFDPGTPIQGTAKAAGGVATSGKIPGGVATRRYSMVVAAVAGATVTVVGLEYGFSNGGLNELTEWIDTGTAVGDGGSLGVVTGKLPEPEAEFPETSFASTSSTEHAMIALIVVPLQVPEFTEAFVTGFSGGSLKVTAKTTLPLGAAAATSNAALALTAKTTLPLGAVVASSNATAVVARAEPFPLGSVAATSSASLALTARTTLSLSATATSNAILSLRGGVPLGVLSAAGLSATSLTGVSTATTLILSAAAGLANATLAPVVPVRITLGTVVAIATASADLTIKAKGPDVRGVGEVRQNTGAMTVPPPAGTEPGDMLLLFIESGGPLPSTEAAVPPEASGWDLVDTQVSNNTRLTILAKTATGADTASVTDTGDHQLAQMLGIKVGTYDTLGPITNVSKAAAGPAPSGEIPGGFAQRRYSLFVGAVAGAKGTVAGAEYGSWSNPDLSEFQERIDTLTALGDGGSLAVVTGKLFEPEVEVDPTSFTAASNTERAMISLVIVPLEVPEFSEMFVSGLSGGSVFVTAKTTLICSASAATANASVALTAKTTIPLNPVVASASPTLQLTAKQTLSLGQVTATSTASLTLTAKTGLGSLAATGTSTATLEVSTEPSLTMSPVVGLSTASLAPTVEPDLSLVSTGTSTAAATIAVKTPLTLSVVAATGTATLALQQALLLSAVHGTSTSALAVRVGQTVQMVSTGTSAATLVVVTTKGPGEYLRVESEWRVLD